MMCQFNKDCYRPQRSCGKVIFSEACVKNSVHGGGDAWQGGMHDRGHAWQQTGMHGKGGMCGRGHAWQQGEHAWQRGGACVAGGHEWQILRDTVNERVLRILLDCILDNTCEGYGVVLLV